MAEKNYTIPINDAFDLYDGCPVCLLEGDLETRGVDYVMGAAMMEPDVRIETNRQGFCADHLSAMLAAGNRLGLALILESYLAEVQEKLEGDAAEALAEASDGCFVCRRKRNTLERYADNIVFLWRTEDYFREKFRKQEFVCLKHASLLMKIAVKTEPRFGKKSGFSQALTDVVKKRLTVVREETERFTRSFDYRNNGQPLGEAAQAVEHTINWILGKHHGV